MRNTRMLGFLAAVAGALVLIVSSRAWAFEGPDGFDKAKFGMSESEFLKVYPRAVSDRPTPAPGDPSAAYGLNAYLRQDLTVGPLKNCRANYHFFRHELYDIQFVCPDKPAIGKYLQDRFGMPNNTTPTALMWAGQTYGVSQVPKVGVFSFHDIHRAQAAQAAILRLMSQAAAGTPTPGAAP